MDMRRRGLELVNELVGVFKLALDQAARSAVAGLAASASGEAPDAPVTGSIGRQDEAQSSPRADVAQSAVAAGDEPMRLAALPADQTGLSTPEAPERIQPDHDQFAGPAARRAAQSEAPPLVYQALGSGAATFVADALQIDGVSRVDVAMPEANEMLGVHWFASGSDEAPLAPVPSPGLPVDAALLETPEPNSEAKTLVQPALLPSPGAVELALPPAEPAPVLEVILLKNLGSSSEFKSETKPEPEPSEVIVIQTHEFYGTERADSIIATPGNDFLAGHDGNDTLDGAGGYNTVGYWRDGGTEGVHVDLVTGQVTGTYGDHDTLINIQNIRGSEQDDIILGDVVGNFLRGAEGDDLIDGRMGDDALFGEAGDDTLSGGAGRETLVGGQGADLIDGGEGYDLLDYQLDGGAVGISVNLKTGFIIDTWGDLDIASNIEGLRATDRDDFIRLSDNGVRVELGGGDDWAFGGAGSDVFVFGASGGKDRVNDFDVDLDTLDLAAAGYDSLDDVLANAVGIDLGVMLDDGRGNVITLVDVNINQLAQLNYVFG